MAVLELSRRPSLWRVRVNGKAVSKPIHLPGSSGRFQPIATAEAWGGGTLSCDRFAYRFDQLAVAADQGSSWRRFVDAHRFKDRRPRARAVGTLRGSAA